MPEASNMRSCIQLPNYHIIKSPNYTWHKIAADLSALSFSPEGIACATAAGKNICVINHNNKLFACAATCPHAGGEMKNGYIDAKGNIVCPVHSYRFSLGSGNHTSMEDYRLKTFPVEQREDGIYVGFAEAVFL